MNILMLTDSMDRGGAETHVLTLAQGLAARGHRLCVASGGGALAQKLISCGIDHVELPLGSRSPLDILRCRRELKKLFLKHRFDLVHSHSRLASVIVSGLARRFGVSFVCTVHARFCVTPLRRYFSKWGQKTIAVSEDLKQYLIEEYGTSPENITVIANGVDENVFLPEARDHDGKIRIAFLSRLDADCSLGARLLCEIAPRLYRLNSNIEIVIGGAGSELFAIRELAKSISQTGECVKIECCGEIADVPCFMNSCDIFVGVSRAAIEAGFCGRTVILCGNEGFAGELNNESFDRALAVNFCARDGWASKADTLYQAIENAVLRTKTARKEAADNVRVRLLENCSARVCVERTEAVYCKALEIKGPCGRGTLLAGYYGFGNMGDDVLLRSAIERAKTEYPNENIRALTRKGRRDGDRFGVVCARRYSPLRVLRELVGCRRLIFGGGTLLQCNTSLRSMMYYAMLLITANALGRECILWGNGIGKADGWIARKILKMSLVCCDHIGARDRSSYAVASHMAPDASVLLEMDLAESKKEEFSSAMRAGYLLRCAFGGAKGKFVVAIPRKTKNSNDVSRLALELARLRRCGSNILIIPMCEREDRAICDEMCHSLGAHTLRGLCFDDLVMIIKESDAVYSMRYHGLVAAKLAGVRFFGIGDDGKISGYCRENGGERI